MKLATKTLLTLTTASLLSASASAATITVEDSFTGGNSVPGTFVSGITNNTLTYTNAELGLSATTADKLVIGFTTRRNKDIDSVTYGGVAMDLAVKQVSGGNNDGTGAIYYLDNPTLGGDLVFTNTVGGNDDFGSRSIFAFVLSGTEDGGPVSTDQDNQTVDPTSVSVTTGADGGFVLAAVGINGSRPGSLPDVVTAGTISGAEFNGSTSILAAWNDTSSATYTVEVSGNDAAGTIAYFAAVPEPGSLALLGLGGLLVGARRRRG